MTESEIGKTEEEIAQLVAETLSAQGLRASSQDTGGGICCGICCVILERDGGGEIAWGTADVNWGAAVSDERGEIVSSIETSCPSDCQDVAAIAEAIKGPSIRAGAVA